MKQRSINTDADRHPTTVQALRRMLQQEEFEEVQFELLEIRATAAGEVTWRLHQARADDSSVGYLPPQ